jgi:ABC-type lipoprotein release transport system permease subunit
MLSQDPEDRFIKNLILLASTGLALGVLVFATIVTVMVSTNFNILEWME